jgi:hypothetical protein
VKSYTIGHKRYIVADKYLLCTATITKNGKFFDMMAKTRKLYYPRGKAFLLVTENQFAGGEKVELLTREQAQDFMDTHPGGIKESVYNRFFGKPEEI